MAVSGYFYIPSSSDCPLSADVQRRNTYMYTHSPTPLPTRIIVHLDVAHARHPTAASDRLCALRRVPAYDAVFCVYLIPSCRPWPSPRYLLAPGAFACCGPSFSMCLRLSFPMCFLVSWHLLRGTSVYYIFYLHDGIMMKCSEGITSVHWLFFAL